MLRIAYVSCFDRRELRDAVVLDENVEMQIWVKTG